KKKQGAKVYPAISVACYFFNKNDYRNDHPVLKSNKMSHLICATECVRRTVNDIFKYFAIANGDRCFCKSELPPATDKAQLNKTCSYRCQQNDKQSCGSPWGIVYFKLEITNTPPESGKCSVTSRPVHELVLTRMQTNLILSVKSHKKKQGAKVYPAIPNSPIQCYKYDGTGIVSLTSNEMSHLICATECVKRDLYGRFKYFAIANGDRCFCKSELPPATDKAQLNKTCSYRCQQNDKQSCGSPWGIVYFKLEITNTPPESDKCSVTSPPVHELVLTRMHEKKQGAKVYPAIPNFPIQCYQYYGTGIVSLTSNEMSHLICATECVKRDLYGRFKYFAIANGDRCFCESELPPAMYKRELNKTCSYRCPRNDKQSCGGSSEIVYFKLEITNTPPESGKCSVTSPPVHDLVLTRMQTNLILFR
uniref:WSC domain-containing protein n=1 Tax=Macrostomum lignano TaxID=282301 RepID=A0A1I8J878_9PLAT